MLNLLLALLLAGSGHPAQRARADLTGFFSSDDYPPAALERRSEGTASFRVRIDAEGSVVDCRITGSAGDPALDAATCAILLGRAHYEPAHDRQGRAVADTDNGRVHWRLPDDADEEPGLPFEPTRIVSRIHVGPNGVNSCTATVNGAPSPERGGIECGTFAGTGVAQLLRGAPGITDMTMVYAYGPAEVEEPAPDEAGYGERALDLVVRLSVAADGRVTDCQPSRREVAMSDAYFTPPEMCAEAMERPLFRPAEGMPVRNARVRFALFYRGRLPELPPPPAGH